MDQDEAVLEDRFHLLRIGDEVGRDVAAVELHAVHGLEIRLESLGFLDRDDAVLADLLHRVGDQIADLLVVVGRDAANLRDLFLPLGGNADFLELFDHGGDRFLDAALDRHRVGAGRHVLETFTEDRLREHRRRRGAVTGDVGGLGRHFLDHLRAHVLERITQLDLFRDGDSVLSNRRCAKLLVDDNIPALRTKRDLDGLRQLVDAALQRRAGLNVEMQFFRSHR